MKFNGMKLDAHYVETIVIPRPKGDIVFKAQPTDYTLFEKLCPQPKPPTVQKPGKEAAPDLKNPKYLAKINKWAVLKTDYMFVNSLTATEGVEWETVVSDKPETWSNLPKELLDSGFTDGEVARIFDIVTSVNGLDGSKIDEATKAYLAAQE